MLKNQVEMLVCWESTSTSIYFNTITIDEEIYVVNNNRIIYLMKSHFKDFVAFSLSNSFGHMVV